MCHPRDTQLLSSSGLHGMSFSACDDGSAQLRNVPCNPCASNIYPPDVISCRCGPCRAVFPHLSDIARKYKDKGLKVIGIGLEEDAPQLKQFVDSQGSKMDYTVRPSCI